MIVKRVYCDHCAKLITEANDYIDIDIQINESLIKADLCADCKKKLVRVCLDFVREGEKNG